MTEPLASVYDPKQYEHRLYNFWVENQVFEARRDSGRKPFTILMPPPNVTSQLHMGHGTGYTMQDVLVRWKRMQGFEALWLPGTDHAGIATQMMVEKSLAAEGLTRQQLGRERFLDRLWAWKDKYGGEIVNQFKVMGFSCDWSRLSFTMDPKLSTAVRRIFVDLFKAGLIYRGERLVNWDPVLKTAISDDEVESVEIQGHLWSFRYQIDGTDEFITIATTRPETMIGDTAIAVHPEDERYLHLVGKKVRLPLTDRLIPIVADEYVRMDFGTGAVKITPAHDPNDFELAKRHGLPFVNVMNDDATLNDEAPPRFRGLPRFEARKEIIRALKELDLFVTEESYKTTVPTSERSKEIIEPRLSLQWYVSMKELAAPAIAAAKDGRLRFHPDLWKKTYLHWLENIQDWCISRQLWWGHRIPVWYCQDCGTANTGMADPTSCEQCHSGRLKQDDDVLDTWFSSWLWPISPFGWPDDEADLAYFYPTDVLVTAPEIIFLWVARMVMVGLKTRGEVPFRDVFLTPTVCDKQGRKFSKTLGNGIDPRDLIAKHGTDAVRFTAVQLAPVGGRTRMSAEDFEAGARFVNKIWNASRLLLGQLKAAGLDGNVPPLTASEIDLPCQWLLDEFADAADRTNKALAAYRINDAADHVYHAIWGSYCDWALETAKPTLQSGSDAAKARVLSTLVFVLDGLLRLASPILPFVTEEIWHKLPAHPDWGQRPKSLALAAYPDPSKLPRYPEAAANWRSVQELISAIRSARTQAGVPPRTTLPAFVKASPALVDLFKSTEADVCRLGSLDALVVATDQERPGQSLVSVGRGFVAFIPASGLIDIAQETKRLKAEVSRIEKVLGGLQAKLGNPSFVDRAPAEVIEQTRAQRANLESQLQGLRQSLEGLT